MKKEIPLDLKNLKGVNSENLRKDYPSEFFNIDFYNNISFVIYKHLNLAFENANQLLINNNQNKFNNLVALFYHHINAILCSYFFSKLELEMIIDKNFKGLFDSEQKQWSISYSQIISNNYNFLTINKIGFKEKIKALINFFDKPENKTINPKVFLHPGCSINLDQIIKILDDKQISVSNDVKVFDKKINIKLFYEQLSVLKNEIFQIFNIINVKGTKNEIPMEKIFDIIDSRIREHVSSESITKYNFDFVALDSLGDLDSRKIAMQCRLQNIPVMSLAHGESSIIDEPLFGPVELTYCNYYISYGEKSCDSLTNGKYTKSLFNDDVKIIPSNSNQVFSLFKNKTIKKISDINSARIMYVPTSFNGNARYGPFRDIHDIAYYSWQYELIKSIKSEFQPKEIFLKYHPKDRFNFYLDIPELEVIKNGNFSDNIDKSDLFIFDFPGSAFSLALATSKPVIYFDIGFRNLSEKALDDIKDRCIYIKSNPIESDIDFIDIRTKLYNEKVNNFTESFCLGDLNKSREETVSNTIYNICLNY
jgi:hypothetical protein